MWVSRLKIREMKETNVEMGIIDRACKRERSSSSSLSLFVLVWVSALEKICKMGDESPSSNST